MIRKEAAMETGKQLAARALFKSGNDQATQWLFVILSEGWAITRDGEQIAAGISDGASIKAGVKQFVSLTAPVPAAVIRKKLDRIEAKNPIRGATQRDTPEQIRVTPEVSAPFSLVRRRPMQNIGKKDTATEMYNEPARTPAPA